MALFHNHLIKLLVILQACNLDTQTCKLGSPMGKMLRQF